MEPVSQASASAAPAVEGNPNPFWSERYQEEFRLLAARPDFLNGEAVSNTAVDTVVSPPEVEAWMVAV